MTAGVVKVAAGLWGASVASATVGLTLSNWVAILGSLASILLTLTAAVLLFIRIRKPRRFIEPADPGPNAGVRVREAYYHALEQYNDAVRDDQP